METFKLPSGATLDVQALSYEAAWGVTQVLLKELENTKIDLSSINLKDIMATDLITLKGPICSILSSQSVLDSAKTCFKKCRYNDSQIDSMTFESKTARGDFLYAAFYALQENVTPFFASLLSNFLV